MILAYLTTVYDVDGLCSFELEAVE